MKNIYTSISEKFFHLFIISNHIFDLFRCHAGIIKEEELDRMDKISKDVGWAQSDEIDYNQKLVFSDDESSDTTPATSKGNKGNDKRGGAGNERDKERSTQQQRKDEDNRAGK